MSNSIALAKAYLPIVDRVYKAEAKSAILDTANSNIRFIGANKVELFKTSMNGFGNYSRNSGFPSGSVTATWEELTLSKDRGVSLMMDAMDNEETLGQAYGTLIGEFVRTQEIPEVDAYRFATYSSAAVTASNYAQADLTVGTTDVAAAIDTADQAMQDAEVPAGSILFLSPKCYNALKRNIVRRVVNNEANIQTQVEYYNDHQVVVVPQGRFNTAITLYDGSTNFGFAPTAGGYKINFLLVHPTAVAQVAKHNPMTVFSPEINQNSDSWKFNTRLYHDAFVLANKTAGVYAHIAQTANA